MESNLINYNPKAINLEKTRASINKVTLGFKCHPSLKLRLAGEASQLGLTLSEYVENVLEGLGSDKQDLEIIINEIRDLKDQVQFYENSILKSLLQQHAGKQISFKNPDGKEITLTIQEPKDVYTVIINSYKAKK